MEQDLDVISDHIRVNNIDVPFSRSRDNPRRNKAGSKTPAGPGRTVMLGPNPYRRKGVQTHFTTAHPELYNLFCDFARKYVPFPVNAFMFNQNYQTRPHYDGMNSGVSAIISFGNYTGGELVVEGEVLDAFRKLCVMDGSKQLHWNNPITSGTKYSIVFFRVRSKKE
jgi:hypothetical protein